MYLKINHLSKEIKGSPILCDIDLSLEGGRVYGLRGKNGSGKTMLIRALCGLIRPTQGNIEIDGKILGKDFDFPPSVGVLIENPSFINRYTGLKNLELLASIKEEIDTPQIQEVLKTVGLDPQDKRTFKKYSLGMKQRLGIAAALMESPDLILLDEPINALDPAGVEEVRELLSEHKKRGALIVVACHDAGELELLSDEIFTMAEGKIIARNAVNHE